MQKEVKAQLVFKEKQVSKVLKALLERLVRRVRQAHKVTKEHKEVQAQPDLKVLKAQLVLKAHKDLLVIKVKQVQLALKDHKALKAPLDRRVYKEAREKLVPLALPDRRVIKV